MTNLHEMHQDSINRAVESKLWPGIQMDEADPRPRSLRPRIEQVPELRDGTREREA